MHTNENLTIGLFKESMIKIVLVNSFHKRVKMLEELQKEMENYVLPIRVLPNRGRKRIYLTNIETTKRTVFKMPIFLSREKCGHF